MAAMSIVFCVSWDCVKTKNGAPSLSSPKLGAGVCVAIQVGLCHLFVAQKEFRVWNLSKSINFGWILSMDSM